MIIPLNPAGSNAAERKNWTALKTMLYGGLGLDNFDGRILSGTTSSSSHTSQTFKHGMKPKPVGGIVVLGNVYLYSIDDTYVDIRSDQTSVEFTILLGYG